ncbi:MAG TPA: cupredoxin domain-containing protein, partial [Solirubrobacterales bacterium]
AALFVIAVAVAVPIAGCGGGDDNDNSSADTGSATEASTGAAATGSSKTVDLSAVDYKFNPSDVSLNQGDVTFRLTNDGQQPHSLEIEDVNGQDQELESDVQPGDSNTLTVNLPPGKYEFYCPVPGHKELGMEGDITVK